MEILELEACIKSFLSYIESKLRNKPYNKASLKKALQRLPVKEAAALKREDILPLLERYHNALNEKHLINDLNQYQSRIALQDCISISYKSYTQDKNIIKNIFWDFAKFLNENYNIDLDFDFTEGHAPSTTFERQIAIVKMLQHNPMTSMEIAKELEISQRAAAEYLTKMQSDSMDEGLIIDGQKVKLSWDKNSTKYEYIATAHPLVLIPNLRQVIALLEGLYSMYNNDHDSYAYYIAQNIWNQLTHYTKDRIKEQIEPLNLAASWYEKLESGNIDLSLYQTERAIYWENRQVGMWDLSYLIKCNRIFDFEYRIGNTIVPYKKCKPIRLNEDNSGLYVKSPDSIEEFLLLKQNIINISE